MQPKNGFLLIVILGICFSLIGCNSLINQVEKFIATETPTSTTTATRTATHTFTPTQTFTPTHTSTLTPTPTPELQLVLHSCVNSVFCDGVYEVRDFIDAQDIYYGRKYAAEVPNNQPVSFYTSWIAKNETLLNQGQEHIQFFFEIDGNSYIEESFIGTASYTIDESDETYPSYFMWIRISGWEIGENHDIRLGFVVDQVISDGWEEYYPGTTYDLNYRISPVLPPTATPTNTPTSTPTKTATFRPLPTNTPYPTNTPVPSCNASSSITINNDTGGYLTLYLTGPGSFHFELPTGTHTISVCPGAYSYTGYGCGGAYLNGTMNSGEEHTFYCE